VVQYGKMFLNAKCAQHVHVYVLIMNSFM